MHKRRICIDFERYSMFEFVSTTRYFKCLEFGHLMTKCNNPLHCAKFSGSCDYKSCNGTVFNCHNCYFQRDDDDCAHKPTVLFILFIKNIRRKYCLKDYNIALLAVDDNDCINLLQINLLHYDDANSAFEHYVAILWSILFLSRFIYVSGQVC